MDDANITGLDADIEALLDAERSPELAPKEAKERVWRRVQETIATAPPVEAVTAPALSTPVVVASLGAVAVLGIWAATGAPVEVASDRSTMAPVEAPVERLMDPTPSAPAPLRPVVAPVVTSEQNPQPEPEENPPDPRDDLKRGASVSASVSTAARKRKPEPRSRAAQDEQALLDRGRRALREGRAGGALRAANEHASRYRNGRLAEERDALRVRALEKVGDREASRRAARSFLSRYPSSIHRLAVERVLRSE